MRPSCKYLPPQVNIKGSDATAESILWKELMVKFGKDRNLVNAIYAISRDEAFREKYNLNDPENQDENGEPLTSLVTEALELTDEKYNVLKFLTDDLYYGTTKDLSYEEAVNIITQWNAKTDNYKKGYLAVLKRQNGSKGKYYTISVVKDTYRHRKELFNQVKDRELSDRFKLYLQSKGATFSVEGDEFYDEPRINGFFNLVKISAGENFDRSLAFQSGLFAVQALSDSPLVERLIGLLSPEVREKLQDEYGFNPTTTETITIGEGENKTTKNISTRVEAAGYLVGQAFLNNLDTKNNWIHNQAYKLAYYAKRFFSRFSKDGAEKRIMLEANAVARKVAQEFVVSNNVEVEDSSPEVNLNLQLTPEALTYENIIKQIKVSIKKLSTICPGLEKDLKNFTNQYLLSSNFSTDEEGNELDEATKRAMYLSRIGEALQHIWETLDRDVMESLSNIKGMDNFSLDNTEEWMKNYSKNAKLLSSAHEKLELANSVLRQVDILFSQLDVKGPLTVKLRNSSKIERDLKSLKNDALEIIGSTTSDLLKRETKFFTQFLTLVEGGEQIQHASRILFKTNADSAQIMETLKKAGKEGKKFYKDEKNTILRGGLYAVQEYTQTIGELLSMKADISLFSAWFASMSNNEDTVGVLLDKAVKEVQKKADDQNFKDARTVIELREEGKKLGLSSDLHEIIEYEDEIDENGHPTGRRIPTGNFVQGYRDKKTGQLIGLNYGKWEDDYYQAKKDWILEWKKTHKTRSATDKVENDLKLQDFLDTKQKEWDKIHSIIEKSDDSVIFGAIKRPNPNYDNGKYVNKDYLKLTKEQRDYVDKWIKFKESKETNIHGAKSYRLPQMSGSTVATLKQHIDREGFFKGIGSAIFPRLRTSIVRGLDAREFGTDDTYNEKEEAWYDEAYRMEVEKIHRLPVYGVRKYTKEDRKTKLSTNIVNTMLAYCVMANTYNSFCDVIDTLDVAKHVLKERDSGINGIRFHKTSRAYSRFDKFLDKQVYNLRTAEITKARWVNGIVNGLNATAAFMYLGGNIPGGAVNLGTGLIQLFSEAAVGEWMSLKSLRRAERAYLLSIPAMLAEDLGGRAEIGMGLTKMSLFLDKFNALDDARTKISSYETGLVGWVGRVLDPMDIAMAPYSIGEKMMQGVTYAAIAMDTKIYNLKESGKKQESTVWDAYDTVKREGGSGVTKNVIALNDGYWVKPNERYSLDDLERHYINLKELQKELEDLQKKLDARESVNVLSGVDLGKEEYKQALYAIRANPDMAITSKNVKSALWKIQEFFNEVEWNESKEGDIVNKAREVNDRLHGIYNKHDKTAFSNNIAGQTILVMKNYAMGYIQAKFAPDHYNEALKQDVEGSFVTLAKVFMLPWMGKNVNFSVGQALRATLAPHSKGTKEMMTSVGFSEHQVYNMRRNMQDFLKILILGILRFISFIPPEKDQKRFEALDGEDRNLLQDIFFKKELLRRRVQYKLKVEDHEKLFGMLYYFSMRLQFEQSAYLLPWKMYSEFHNILNLTPVATSALWDLCELTYLGGYQLYDKLTNEDEEDRSDKNLYYQSDDPRGKYEAGDSKFWVNFAKRTPYLKSLYWWEHPYEAAQSFEYAARLRSGK